MPDVLDDVVAQHAEEVVHLWLQRSALLNAPDVRLRFFNDHDERLSAHLEGLVLAGPTGWRHCEANLGSPNPGAMFGAVVIALESSDIPRLEQLLRLFAAEAVLRAGFAGAFGWVSQHFLQRTVRAWLSSSDVFRRCVGLTACAMHRVDPGLETGPWLADPAAAVRARALRAAGEFGLHTVAPRCVAALTDEDAECQFWAAWSAVLLGHRGTALDTLSRVALDAAVPHRARAFRLMLQTMDRSVAHTTLQTVAHDSAQVWWLIQGSGVAGDATYVPWLVGHMAAPETARAAGEAFTLITGADLDVLQLWRAQPDGFESGPNENPDDENVDMDPDEGLPWPDPEKVKDWWARNSSRFAPGQRYFMGAPVTRGHCIDVLKNGYQRQRILAAHYLCLLDPGTPLFNTSAPAWRQQRLLAEMR